jgi:hypothetical protein
MDGDTQRRAPLEQKLMERETDQALSRNGVARTSPLRDEILSRGRIIMGYHEPAFRVTNDQGSPVTVDAFIRERRCDPSYGSDFPPERPRISRHDQKKLAANFAAIAAGEVIVE